MYFTQTGLINKSIYDFKFQRFGLQIHTQL